MRDRNRYRRMVTVLVVVGLAIIGLQRVQDMNKSSTTDKIEPAQVEPIPGTQLNRLLLSARAAERLGIQTTPVRWDEVSRSRTQRLVIPYASVIYGLHGETWTYTNPEPLVFVRQPVSIDYIDGDLAVLLEGPSPETLVVTVGVAELYGAETGVGK